MPSLGVVGTLCLFQPLSLHALKRVEGFASSCPSSNIPWSLRSVGTQPRAEYPPSEQGRTGHLQQMKMGTLTN